VPQLLVYVFLQKVLQQLYKPASRGLSAIIIIIIIIIITNLYSAFRSEDTEALDAAQED